MSGLLLARLPQIAGIVAIVASHAAVYALGSGSAYERGVIEGHARALAESRAAAGRDTARQLEDRINAENRAAVDGGSGPDDGLRCGPSTRDCPARLP